ncbi:DUF2231 domain-containing protein [Marinimicrobium sp. ABcell2]|uniref:DUF2231 domain-containing protein n=1 Tax=Marinimicrobium sp. ABcell2 TaxID=3069751 RepID=UPI0027B3B3F5|nr:DUF2231 domain-containing protein [Marinimicrobium sp. ABcell2]MDQ2077081.1 hypothetical protein [Marinimicrobium sp. ABcell2]
MVDEPYLWHPMFVNFGVSLLMLTGLLQLLLWSLPWARRQRELVDGQKWLVGLGTAAVLATAFTGFVAYDTVPHDEAAHAAMHVHRNWAIAATIVYLLGAALFFAPQRWTRHAAGVMFVVALGLVAVTANHGGKLVFEHGLGVQSLPEVNGNSHDH